MNQLPNLHRDLMRAVTADHGGVGDIKVYRAFGPRHAGLPDAGDPDDGDTAMPADAQVAHIDLVMVPPGRTIGRHRHGSDRETYVLLSGRARMYRADEEFAVGPGDVIVNPPFTEHGLVNDSAEEVHLLVYEVAPVRT